MSVRTLERMVRAAILAPSLHNSQPWRFEGAWDRLEMLVDRSRALPVVDPDGRWLHVSSGAAVLNAVLAGRVEGRACHIRWDGDGDRVATIELGESSRPGADDLRLARAIPLRRTDRQPFAPGRLPAALVDELRAVAAREGCWTHTFATRAEVSELSDLLRRAEAEQRADPAYREELAAWVRPAGSPAPDGVPASALPVPGPDRMASDVWLRDFDAEAGRRRSADEAGEPAAAPAAPHVERPLVLVLGTAGDGQPAWWRTGMAMQRVLLTATVAGVAGSPLTQALELPAYRDALRRLVGIDGHPQIVLRLGYPASTLRPAVARRDVSDVLSIRTS